MKRFRTNPYKFSFRSRRHRELVAKTCGGYSISIALHEVVKMRWMCLKIGEESFRHFSYVDLNLGLRYGQYTIGFHSLNIFLFANSKLFKLRVEDINYKQIQGYCNNRIQNVLMIS